MLDLLLGLLTKTLNMSEDDLKAVILKEGSEDELNEDALQSLLTKDADRIKAIKDGYTESKDNQYKRGLKEGAEKIEGTLKEKFGIEEDLTGEDLIAKAVETLSGRSGEGEMSESDVKTHPVYIALQNEKSKEIARMQKEHEQALANAESEFNTKMTKTSVNQRVLQHIRSKNPILPEDPKKADKRLRTILPELDQYKFEQDGNEIIVKDSNGQMLTDAHNNVVTFDRLVDTLSEDYFDFQSNDSDDTQGTGNGGNDFGKRNFDKITIPKDSKELEQALKVAKSPEERQKISEAFLESQNAES